MKKTEIFNAFETELHVGANLIEASAGTGKTFAIAMLVVRLIVEKAIKIDEIIVTTFTNAATAELKERIRSRIREALLLAKQKENLVSDKLLKSWYHNLSPDIRELAYERLTLALLEIDSAAVFTIHGFCQRMLVEFALETGQLFNLELTDDINHYFDQVTEDFWRTEIYVADAFKVEILRQKYKMPSALLKSVKNGYTALRVYPDFSNIPKYDIDSVRAAHQQAIQSLNTFSEILAPENEEKFKKGEWAKYMEVIHQPEALLSHATMFTEAGLKDTFNGHKFRKNKNQSSDERKDAFISEYEISFAPFEHLYETVQKAQQAILLGTRYQLLEKLKESVPKRLLEHQMTSFDGLIQGLADAVKSDNLTLINGLQQRYKVALIDEFQDTDKDQWDIFAAIFLSTSHYLYLIGDPKQAIYKFRGADIFTYFSVAEQVNQKYTLAYNWRSHPGIVKGVNCLFESMDKPFVIDDFAFESVSAAKTDEDGEVVDLFGQAMQPMQLAFVNDENPLAQCLAEKIVALLDGKYAIQSEKEKRSIKASDIAILVGSHKNAEDYQKALWQVNVPVTISRTASVFRSVDAQQLLKILYAVCYPSNLIYLKAMLSTDYFGLNAVSYYEQFLQSEDALDGLVERFSIYHQLWLNEGFMPMITILLADEGINENLLNQPRFERRLTDVTHLSELMQQAISMDRLGMFKALEWFQQQIEKAGENLNSADEQKIRLDSEKQTVTIITMHASKGLEYPIVFCPDLAKSPSTRATDIIKFNEQGVGQVVDIGSDNFEQHQQQLAIENLSEKMRLFYVAITRAKYLCYLIWPHQKTAKSLSIVNHSPLSFLLGLSNINNLEMVTSQFEKFSAEYPEIFNVDELKIKNLSHKPTDDSQLSEALSPWVSTKPIDQTWQMTSYTALSRLSDDSMQQDIAYIKAEDETIVDDKELALGSEDLTIMEEDLLPKGAATGNLIHEILEKFSFYLLAQDVYEPRIEQELIRYCKKFSLLEDIIPLVKKLLINSLKTPLSVLSNTPLSKLSDNETLKEMPFYLSLAAMNTQQINKILANERTFQPIGYKQIEGLMNGFIDLIFMKQGKYYIADYKSNYLPSYDQSSLIEAMHHHNYGLQLWIYSVVLHRFLQNSLPDYAFEKHFGGVFYFFVRGMHPDHKDRGVYYQKPDIKTLTALSDLLTEEVVI